MSKIALAVNGSRHEADVEPRQLLVYFLREQLGLKGTSVGCDTSSCGACTVLLDGESAKWCTVLRVRAGGGGGGGERAARPRRGLEAPRGRVLADPAAAPALRPPDAARRHRTA